MTIDRTRRLTFEDMADLYAEVRPGYPEVLVDDVLALSAIPPGGRILEIGCGPGNATLPFARRGYQILGIELGERLARIAALSCREYPGVRIQNVAFEEWPLEEKAFDLAISADAFHWIPPEIGYPKVARALKDTGSAALFWFVPVDPQTDWSRAIDEVYRQRAPGVENPDRSYTAEWLTGIIQGNLAASGCLGEATVRQYAWSQMCTSDLYLKRLQTFSGHRGLDEATRSWLFEGIREVIEAAGGVVIRPQVVALFHTRVKR